MLEHSVVWFCRLRTVRAVAAAAVAALVSAGPSFGQQMDERWYEPTDWFEADDFVYDDDDYDDFDDFDDGYYVYDYDYDDRDEVSAPKFEPPPAEPQPRDSEAA